MNVTAVRIYTTVQLLAQIGSNFVELVHGSNSPVIDPDLIYLHLLTYTLHLSFNTVVVWIPG